MCGIAGFVAIQPQDRVFSLQSLDRMQGTMLHRGPDDGGSWINGKSTCGLCNRRLAILDISPAGHMPMTRGNGSCTLTYNGEIYNFKELRAQLESCGHSFSTRTDTEVVLYAYIQWGTEFVKHLRGMFALALWDESKQQLLLARDKLGVKPLYYTTFENKLIFASELNTLLSGLPIRPVVSADSVIAYLRNGSIPAPLSIYKDVWMLMPAHYILWENGSLQTEQYWHIPQNITRQYTETEAGQNIFEILKEAVQIQMVTDVPIGAFLSGGLDSSSIVALMRASTNGPIRTCSIVFDEDNYSEASFAKTVSQMFSTDHHEYRLTGKEVAQNIEHIVKSLDQPTIDGINTYYVSKVARESGLTVALSGLGGDELFAGYVNTFQGIPQLYRYALNATKLPYLPHFASRMTQLLYPKWNKLSDAITTPTLAGSYQARRGLFSVGEVQLLVKREYIQASSFNPYKYIEDSAGKYETRDLFYWISRAEIGNYTLNQLLRDTDVMSMANSLEVRVPFLDHVLIETIHQTPHQFHYGSSIKPLLRQALHNKLPARVLNRHDKQGFTFPFDIWMKNDLKAYIDHMLAPDQIVKTQLLRPDSVLKLRTAFTAGKLHWSRIWSIAILSAFLTQNA